MKVLQALFFPPEQPGGVSSMVPYIQDKFTKLGWEMELFSLPKRIRGKGQALFEMATFDYTAYSGNEIIDKYVQTFKDYLWWTKLRLAGNQYDLIHAHHPIAALVMKHVFPETPVIITIHSSYEKELLLNKKIAVDGPEVGFLTSLYGELEHQLEAILTVSESFKTYLQAYLKTPEAVTVIPNGFDSKRFKPIPHDNKVTQLVSLCRLVPAKGLDTLLLACGELKRRGRPFVLHLIGDGPSRAALEKIAIEQDVYNDTIFYGYMLHPEEFMPFFDVFVLPSRAESFGSVFAEAALCHLAIVGSNVGGIPEQIDPGVNGLLVDVDDWKGLADGLEQLILDPDYRYGMARSAYERAKKMYSLTRVISELKKIYVTFGPQM
jgi:glycosyltransferase involved in cell wall biosynthesis